MTTGVLKWTAQLNHRRHDADCFLILVSVMLVRDGSITCTGMQKLQLQTPLRCLGPMLRRRKFPAGHCVTGWGHTMDADDAITGALQHLLLLGFERTTSVNFNSSSSHLLDCWARQRVEIAAVRVSHLRWGYAVCRSKMALRLSR